MSGTMPPPKKAKAAPAPSEPSETTESGDEKGVAKPLGGIMASRHPLLFSFWLANQHFPNSDD